MVALLSQAGKSFIIVSIQQPQGRIVIEKLGTWSSESPNAASESSPKSHCSSSYYKAPRGHNHLSSQSATSNYSHRSTTGPGVVIKFLLHDPILLESDIIFLDLDLSALAECNLS